MKRFACVAFACLTAVSSFAQNPPGTSTQEPQPWTLGGSLLIQPLVSYASDVTFGSASTLGLSLRAGGGRARAEASIEAAVLTGASAQIGWAIAASPFARADELLLPSSSPTAGPDAAIAARVRTLYAKLDLDWAAFTAGRQVLNYGRGALWTPTDIFTELDLAGISPVRRGTDAVQYLLAGACLVQVGTASFADPRASARVLSELTAYMRDHRVSGIRELIGAARSAAPPQGESHG